MAFDYVVTRRALNAIVRRPGPLRCPEAMIPYAANSE
jgi:hypothetical protein